MSKVKITGHASGSGTITLTGPNTSSDRTITLPDETGTVALGVGIDDNADATAITIDSSENVGIGVTPESWHSSYTALQVGAGGSIADWDGTDNGLYIGANWYYDDADRYIETNEATNYIQEAGIHRFKVASSGSADAAITWTTAMTIDNSGYITKPAQPVATASWNSSLSVEQITADVIYVNIGSHLAASGRFTAPIAGTYWYSFTGMSGSAGNHLSIRLYKNNTGLSNDLTAYTDDETYAHATSFGYITLAANDYLEFRNMLTTLHTSYGTINFALVA